MATSTKITTSTGLVKRTGSQRRYLVVDAQTGYIVYRTDDLSRAKARRRFERIGTFTRYDVIDRTTGHHIDL